MDRIEKLHIRWMIRRDLIEVSDIEQSAFEFPWAEKDFVICLCRRNCIGMVAELGGRVVGFTVYELFARRIHVLNFAVSLDHRRKGVGSEMAKKLIGKLESQRRTRLSLEVRETNLAAQMFFSSHGFRATSVLRDFYDDVSEDAYLMQYTLREPCEV